MQGCAGPVRPQRPVHAGRGRRVGDFQTQSDVSALCLSAAAVGLSAEMISLCERPQRTGSGPAPSSRQVTSRWSQDTPPRSGRCVILRGLTPTPPSLNGPLAQYGLTATEGTVYHLCL